MYNTNRERNKTRSHSEHIKEKTYNNTKIHRLLNLGGHATQGKPHPQLHYLKRIIFALQVRMCVDLGLVVEGLAYTGVQYNTLLSSICVMFMVADLDYST